MERTQIAELVNAATQEVLGETTPLAEDLSNVVDVGDAVMNNRALDNYVRSLQNHIGRVIFVNRPYAGGAPSVLMDGWQYGSIMEKISMELPEAEENETWELVDGASYDPHVFHAPKVSAKFFNKRVTFNIPMSFAERQVRESFSNGAQLNAFLSMIYDNVEKALTVKEDSLIMRTINNFIGETLYSEFSGGSYSGSSGVRAVNLLYLYNQRYSPSPSLSAANAVTDPDFIRFAAYIMGKTRKRMSKISRLFNIGGQARFTSDSMLHAVLLADFKEAADVFLQSSTFNEQFTRLPNAEEIPYWQGSGTGYGFSDTSKIYIRTSCNHDIEASGILGVMFDRDALGVANLDRRVTTDYTGVAEFYNNYYKFDAGYFNDQNENFVVFFVA